MAREQRASLALPGSLSLFLLLQAVRVVLGLPAADKHSASQERELCRWGCAGGGESHSSLVSLRRKMMHEEGNKVLTAVLVSLACLL